LRKESGEVVRLRRWDRERVRKRVRVVIRGKGVIL
jgi:hypothetical protein